MINVNNTEHIKALRHRPFVKGIRRLPVDSPLKGPVLRKPYDVMYAALSWVHLINI